MHFAKKFPFTEKAFEFEKKDKDSSENKIKAWNFKVKRKRKIDHAGVSFEFNTPSHSYYLDFYDVRHWNDEENRWYEEGESLKDYLKTDFNHNGERYKTHYLRNWIDRFDLWNKLKEEFGYSSLEKVVEKLKSDNPHLAIFNTLFKHKN